MIAAAWLMLNSLLYSRLFSISQAAAIMGLTSTLLYSLWLVLFPQAKPFFPER